MTKFYCDECGKHVEGEYNEVHTRRGYEWRVCNDCLLYCKYCDESYVKVDQYAHDDCDFQYHRENDCSFEDCSYCEAFTSSESTDEEK